MPGEAEPRSDYTTGDLRKNLSDALGRAHFQGDVVHISHHGKPYAAVVSQEYAGVIEVLKATYQKKGWSELKLKERLQNILKEGAKDLDEIVSALVVEDEGSGSRSKPRQRTVSRG